MPPKIGSTMLPDRFHSTVAKVIERHDLQQQVEGDAERLRR